MDSIATARDFFINQQGLSPDQADMIVSQGLQAYNQQAQPQKMMQMASGGIARLGYQLGGLSTMPMDYGQSLQVPQQQPQPNFSSAQNITMNPLLNYGQTPIANGGGTPLTMRGGGIARLGYEAGGVTLPSQGSELSQMQGMDQQQALQTIIQILIENGIPPEQAQELALQIIQIFAQGGAPAVEAFADQLEQEEIQAMAGGGIAGLYPRQGYFLGKIVKSVGKAVSGVVKGVANAVKSVAKSPIGRAALTIAAATFLGPGAFGIQGLGLSGLQLGLATAGANLGLQALGGQKLNLLEAGLSGFSAGLSNPTVPASSATNITVPGVDAATNLSQGYSSAGVAPLSLTGGTGELIAPAATSMQAPLPIGNLTTTPPAPTFFETAKAVAMDPSISGIKALAQQGLTDVRQYVQDEPYKALGIAAGAGSLATLGAQLGIPRNEGEDDDAYAKRLEEAQGYITQYGRNLQIRNPYFYQREGAVNPFAPTMAGTTMAADGGIMGYAKGGSMVPPARQIEGGIIELDARKTGGYIPYGKKERVDDVPAMLAKDEFVFTSRAVKAAGGGSARRGAAKMYKLMKQLESKGMKMERGART